jgi:hypothetical protein
MTFIIQLPSRIGNKVSTVPRKPQCLNGVMKVVGSDGVDTDDVGWKTSDLGSECSESGASTQSERTLERLVLVLGLGLARALPVVPRKYFILKLADTCSVCIVDTTQARTPHS